MEIIGKYIHLEVTQIHILKIDDNGNLKGVNNCKDIEEKISNGIRTNIYPDARIFVSINTGKIEDKEYIIIKVSKGIDIYYLLVKPQKKIILI